MKSLMPYSKFLIALLGAVLTVVNQFYGQEPSVQTAISLFTALGVYQVRNVAK